MEGSSERFCTDELCIAVSSPSVVHSKPSKQSITASEDYYSLSGDSANTAHDSGESNNHIHRYRTPPSRYRTPLQSRDYLLQNGNSTSNLADPQNAIDEATDPEVRKTPMRGEGKRRQSYPESSSSDSVGVGSSTAAAGAATALREGGIRRKPVPSTVMEADLESPRSQEFIDASRARSSAAQDIDREQSPVTPGDDDTPYIRFALDQLTRDEEVGATRHYPGAAAAASAAGAGAATVDQTDFQYRQGPVQPTQVRQQQQERDPGAGIGPAAATGVTVLGAGAAAAGLAHAANRGEEPQQQPSRQWAASSRPIDQPPQRHPRHVLIPDNREPSLFIHVTNEGRHQQPLDFLPGILHPLSLILFLIYVLAVLALMLVCSCWSLTHKGIFDYGTFGDGFYFVFEYLPTLLGMITLFWLVQIQVAVYRVAPFIAMSSDSPRSWEEGARLPIYPRTFLLPYIGHFRAQQAIVGFFMVVCWLQIFAVPLLATAFNVYFFGAPNTGIWRWIATAGLIWPVIGLYLLLVIAVVLLLLWLRKQQTGLRWDPRSLADMVVLLERSNALTSTEEDDLRHDAPRLGYWRTSRGGNEVFHTYGITDKAARRYTLENGRIVEKAPLPSEEPAEPKSRFSDPDVEMSREQRHSREKMLPKHIDSFDAEGDGDSGGRAVPWYLRPSAALLWVIVAFVLLLAFLIVSYLPSTAVSKGFSPLVPAPVNTMGYSTTNFLYSFIPAVLATICFLGLLDIDYAYRRLQPLVRLLADDGELAEKSMLLSYSAELPGIVTGSAIANGDYRVAGLSIASLLAAALPILGGGVFWAQFYIPTQSIRISAHMPGYYALSAFVAVYACAFLLAFPWDRKTRDLDPALPRGNRGYRWKDIVGLFRGSRLLDDVAFHGPRDKTDLVTRLLIAPPESLQQPQSVGRSQEAASGSKVSLADSVRGYGRARQQAGGLVLPASEVPRYGLGVFTGRDGRQFTGIDRLRS